MLYPEEKGILQALKDAADSSKPTEWIALKRIAQAFSQRMGRHYSTMATSAILNQLGQPFDGRKRKAEGTYVLVVYRILMMRLFEIQRKAVQFETLEVKEELYGR